MTPRGCNQTNSEFGKFYRENNLVSSTNNWNKTAKKKKKVGGAVRD